MSAIGFSKGLLLPAPNLAYALRVPLVGRGIVGIEFECLLELSLSSGKIPVVSHLVGAQNGMGTSQGRILLWRIRAWQMLIPYCLALVANPAKTRSRDLWRWLD